VIERILETFFRHKLLIILPPVVIPLIVGPIAIFSAPSYYEAFAGVWTERPAYLKSLDESSSWLTPAQIQRDRITEMLQSRSFVMDVAARTSYAPLLASPGGPDRVHDMIGRGLGINTTGSHMLVIRFRGQTPQLAVQVVTAVVEAYQERVTADRASQAELAISFYQSRMQEAQTQLVRANDALRRYLAANPRLTTPDIVGGTGVLVRPGVSLELTDPQLGELRRRADVEQRNVERMQTTLDQARLDAASSQQSQEFGFQVVDPPQVPTRATRELRRILVFPIAAALTGLGIGGVLLVLLIAADRSVRSEADLAGTVRVLGSVPQLQLKRLPQLVGPNSARRAIGFPAGTALPPPRSANS
jgi:uncharacterized protein involved in exopolysaccharide biosynthesis